MHIHEEETAKAAPSRHRGVAGEPALTGHAAVLHLQRTAGNGSVAELLEGDQRSPVQEVVGSGGGAAMDDATRGEMEGAFGRDFSDVRVHTDAKASESARSISAHAYTSGTDIVFQSGRYSPGSDDGKRMLAHELTHVVQQKAGPVAGTPTAGGISLSDPGDAFEREADRVADTVVSGGRAGDGSSPATTSDSVQRQAEEEEEVQGFFVQRQEGEEEEAEA